MAPCTQSAIGSIPLASSCRLQGLDARVLSGYHSQHAVLWSAYIWHGAVVMCLPSQLATTEALLSISLSLLLLAFIFPQKSSGNFYQQQESLAHRRYFLGI